MGKCMALPTKDIPTFIKDLTMDSGIITFKIPNEQQFPQLIKGIRITILDPLETISMSVIEAHHDREITIDLAKLSQLNSLNLQSDTKIEYRLAYEYRNFIAQPTKVASLVYNPGSFIKKSLRANKQTITKNIQNLIKQIQSYKNTNAKYYDNKKLILNILLLGSKGSGKSSYISQLSKLVCSQIYHPQIGSHHQSTTSSFDKYSILDNNSITINIIDSPGISEGSLTQIFPYLQGKKNTKTEDYQTLIHCVIVFIDTRSINSMKMAEEIIRMLVGIRIQYIIVLTHWENKIPIYEQFYLKKQDKIILQNIKKQTGFMPMESRLFPISNIKSKDGNKYAQFMILQCFKQSLQLASHFYLHYPPLHILIDDKIIDIKHRIRFNMSLYEFIAFVELDSIIKEHGFDMNNLYVEVSFGRKDQTKKGVIKFQKQKERTTNNTLQDYIKIVDKKYRTFNIFTKVPLFTTQINP